MKAYLSLLTLSIVLVALVSGCDKCFVSQVEIAPSSKDIIVTDISEKDKALALFMKIAGNLNYPIKEAKSQNGETLYYTANGPYYFGPVMTFRTKESVIIIEVYQYAGLAQSPSYKELKKKVYKAYTETFGQDRVSMKKIM
ncbi:MAG: hypothetical protein ACYSWZ_11515 [Planctomycetota bacterium]|jgi:hypothetical protein